MSTAAESSAAPGALRAHAGLACSVALLFLAGPGVLARDGLPWQALIALSPWCAAARVRSKRAFLRDWLWGGVLVGLQMFWLRHVMGFAVVLVAAGLGWPTACAGALLRRMPARWSLALAAPLAWCAGEAVRHVLPQPFGIPWLQLGHALVDWSLVRASAPVWGVWGASWLAAACAGALAQAVAAWRGRASGARFGFGSALALAAPLSLAWLAAASNAPPASVPGPRILIVQPGIPQDLKREAASVGELFGPLCQQTLRALYQQRAHDERGAPARDPELVCWGETMLSIQLVAPGVVDAVKGGLAPDKWYRELLTPEYFESWDAFSRECVEAGLFGQPFPGRASSQRLWPRASAFLSGAETWLVHEGRIRRANTVQLWDAEGRRAPPALKTMLVPGGETLYGIEGWGSMAEWLRAVTPWTPDFLAGDEVGVLELAAADGRRWRFGATVCFDNAFAGPLCAPVAREAAAGRAYDFHLVVSNEAWYRDSFEADQMMAFSRLIAAASQRWMVRVTNSGVSACLDARGEERARLVRDGRDRELQGELWVEPEVPAPGALPAPSLYTQTWRWWPWGLLAAALAAAFLGSRAARNRSLEAG